MGFLTTFRWVANAYRRAALPTRLHVLGRFLSCPFLRVRPYLPPNARLLDLGAGHGLFARLALLAGARAAVAVEPDLAKVCETPRHPGVATVAGYADAVSGTFDAVSICDVLYRIPIELWDGLLSSAHDRLPPGGVLLIDDVLTSGATADACATALKKAGASKVFVLTAARTPSA